MSLFFSRALLLKAVFICIALVSSSGYGQDEDATEKGNDKKDPNGSVEIEFDENKTDVNAAGTYAAPIEEIFNNPAFASGLASGADAINKSLETLMDSLFYSLLDNEFRYDVTEHTWFSTQLQRDLYSTPSGSYVVVDRINLGPKYAKNLWSMQNVPVTLGVDGSVDFMQIYLRTDGMRVAEQEELSTWRRWTNNWFGLLPIMARVLPPSFNQNELYDPIKQLETPFVFPFSLENFYGMTVGSIRSYAISGGVSLGIDIAGFVDSKVREQLTKLKTATARLPYAVFARGEHRINVLRRDDNTAWIGLSKVRRFGHTVNLSLGDKLYILKGALSAQAHGAIQGKSFAWDWSWVGVPLAMFPFDISFQQALARIFDQVYEYDLRIPEAQQAYLEAVKGDFASSYRRYLDAKEKGMETGVVFHFTRNQDRTEYEIKNGPNIGVYRNARQNERTNAEVEITDSEGKFYILEGKQDTTDKVSDILVGSQVKRYQEAVELNVKRVVTKQEVQEEKKDPKLKSDLKIEPENQDAEPVSFSYVFAVDEEPMRLTLSMSIQDGYVTTTEYQDYLDEVRFFTHLPVEEAPVIEVQDLDRVKEHRQQDFFVSPDDEVTTLHVMPSYLGRFGAQVGVSISNDQLDHILEASDDAKWKAFAKAFGQDPEEWGDAARRDSLWTQTAWFKAFLMYPLRIFNIRFAKIDAIKESSAAIESLDKIATVKKPLEKLNAFYDMFDTDHPACLAHALLLLTNINEIPRSVTFTAQPKGSTRNETKVAFGKMNGKTFNAGPPFPMPSRYAKAKQKLSAFYLDQPRDPASRPSINKVQVTTKEIPSSVRGLTTDSDFIDGLAETVQAIKRDGKHVFIILQARNINKTSNSEGIAKVYVRVEQGGKVKIGKLQLAEKVLDLKPLVIDSGIKMETQIYEFYLTGPLSPLSNFMLNRSVKSGDEFIVTLAVSGDGASWSDERQLEFRFVDGKLLPPL